MYAEQTYTIWLPDFRKIKEYVSSEELRLRRKGGLDEEYERLLQNHDEILRNHNDILRSHDLVQKQQDMRALRMQRARPLEERYLRASSLNPTRRFRENLGYPAEWQDVRRNELYNYADSFGSSRGRGRNRDTRPISVARKDNQNFGNARRQRSTSLPPLPYTWPKLFAHVAHHLTNREKDVAKTSGTKKKRTNSNKRNPTDTCKSNPKVIDAHWKIKDVFNDVYSFEQDESKEDICIPKDPTERAEQEVSKTEKAPQGTS